MIQKQKQNQHGGRNYCITIVQAVNGNNGQINLIALGSFIKPEPHQLYYSEMVKMPGGMIQLFGDEMTAEYNANIMMQQLIDKEKK